MPSYAYPDRQPVRSQFRPRRSPGRLIGVHTSENPPDVVGTDNGAEAVETFIFRRSDPGSYHGIADSDSRRYLADPLRYESNGARYGFNRHTIHIAAATRAHAWGQVPEKWRQAIGLNLATLAAEFAELADVPIVRLRNQRVALYSNVRGLIAHADMDPYRRTDPGFNDDEWDAFLEVVRSLVPNQPDEIGEVDMTNPVVDCDIAGPTPTGGGRRPLWRARANGTVEALNGAVWHGDMRQYPTASLQAPVVALVATARRDGYWLIGADGAILAFDAPYPPKHAEFMRDVAPVLHQAIHDAELDPATGSLVLIAGDGGTFEFAV